MYNYSPFEKLITCNHKTSRSVEKTVITYMTMFMIILNLQMVLKAKTKNIIPKNFFLFQSNSQ